MTLPLAATHRPCGSCTLCCKLLTIPELPTKRAGVWCPFERRYEGCACYEDRPEGCRAFWCLWTEAALRLPEVLRPDRCRVVFLTRSCPTALSASGQMVLAVGDPDRGVDLFQRGAVRSYIQGLTRRGVPVFALCGTDRLLFPPRGADPHASSWQSVLDLVTPHADHSKPPAFE
jgi:hypothetical protein